mmetsp:Transcript_43080/g.49655  ORF Transcript_43080/g.49655 Transcript_43080/m.49655 type:complete len:139 (-) Transcript_43080:14-430(-)|eukprot:CAMPEP_0170780412 /NCGR_PEP_ID=MMETSP0733-20121128/13584_1 /TAXON_ID=186038 /ORGANISM="Fragilariopsis kerguelensis, Strain L26-C5" /LENGTH=138 /DNA_ID=CAMNT_0011124247 /DNA_START=100 /DNA_END=513 /DNA_ORIENTATION=-
MKFLLPTSTSISIALFSVMVVQEVVVHAGEAGDPPAPMSSYVCQTTSDSNCMDFYSNGEYKDMTDGTRYCVDANDACRDLDQANVNATDICGVPMEEITECGTSSSAAATATTTPVSTTMIGISLATAIVGGIINVLV